MPLWKGLPILAVHAVKHLLAPRPERAVSLLWLLQSDSRLKRRFRKHAKVTCQEEGAFQIVTVNGEKFVWPAGASLRTLLILCAEVMVPNHPHQYLWGPTRVRPGDVVLDVGACEGSFAAKVAQLGAHVIAVEPSRLMIQAMRRLFELRGLSQPIIRECLLGQEQGKALFLEDSSSPAYSKIVPGPTEGAYEIPMLTLDELARSLDLQRLDFVKCDVEGAEESVLRGGEETLRRFRPKVAVCTYETDHQFMDICKYLSGLGYRVRGKGLSSRDAKLRVTMLHAW